MVLLFSSATSVALASQPVTTSQISVPVPLETVLQVQASHHPDFDSDVLVPLRAAQKAEAEQVKRDEEAAAAAQEAANAVVVEQPAPPPVFAYTASPQAYGGALTGSLGSATPYGNCVLQIPIGIRPPGDPITWAVLTETPYIGAIALFPYNHTGMVVGIWSNGDLEIAHQNFGGGQHRFSRWSFRGFR